MNLLPPNLPGIRPKHRPLTAVADVSTLDWNDFRFFLAVARAGTVSAAARALQIDQATVGRRVAALEAALGLQLFERSPLGYRLTAAGEALVEPAERIEMNVIGAKAQIDEFAENPAGALRIGSSDAFGAYFLGRRLPRLRAALQGMHVDLVALTRDFSLSKREADIATGISLPTDGRLYSRKLVDLRLGLYASPDYLAERPPIRSFDDLAHHDLIGWVDDLIYWDELKYNDRISTRTRPIIGCSNYIAQMQVAIGGGGIGVLPIFLGDQETSLVQVLNGQFPVVLPLYLFVHASMRELRHVRTAIDFIVGEVEAARSSF
ncbi:LysR family transcriptional regulator [Methylobacterium durans]|uniref:LysR family transcriptional regulator n=1 Tax=Methylobacterium durans TaxID=2202825 RepID=UPI002AFF59B1|nr:LysR family transcriptional regulator [Methylobacterium durans]MEA1834385.1 LysR family transcriptional regulator [Methylobacterium durans]